MPERDVVILAGCRTPIGRFGGALAGVPAVDLGAHVLRESLTRAAVDPGDVGEVILGNVLSGGLGLNPARQAALEGGLPESVPAFTVNKACGSGLKAVSLAAQAIAAGESDVILAGGMESMSRAPFTVERPARAHAMGDVTMADSMLGDGLICPTCQVHMGVTAENIAEDFAVERADQDRFAAQSQARAAAAIDAGAFDAEIAPIEVAGRKAAVVVDRDEHPRPGTDEEALAGLRPAFAREGTVTAGNASGINDGAAALVVAAEDAVPGAEPLARIRGWASAGVAPRIMGMGPVPAIRAALEAADLTAEDVGLFEINEAFAAQSLAVVRELGLDPDRVNVHGGAIALGHPVGASGARVLVTLLHAMRTRGERLGVAALCIGGGQGIAMVVEAV